VKHPGKAAVGIFLTVFLLWFVMKDVDFADVIANIAKVTCYFFPHRF